MECLFIYWYIDSFGFGFFHVVVYDEIFSFSKTK